VGLTTVRGTGAEVVAVVANRLPPGDETDYRREDVTVFTLPEVPLLMAPTVGQVAEACEGEVLAGSPEGLGREALGLMVAAMAVPHVLERLVDGAVVITPGDRVDVLLGALFAHASTALPSVAGIVLTGGLRPPDVLLRPIEGFPELPPIV